MHPLRTACVHRYQKKGEIGVINASIDLVIGLILGSVSGFAIGYHFSADDPEDRND